MAITPDISYEISTETESERPVFELRLLGMRADEAIKSLEHQIDLCTLNNFPSFSVIHGKGDGILQQAVRDYLSHCPVVKEFEVDCEAFESIHNHSAWAYKSEG